MTKENQRRSSPFLGWLCRECWWCCWTSPVPLVDTFSGTNGCCSENKR